MRQLVAALLGLFAIGAAAQDDVKPKDPAPAPVPAPEPLPEPIVKPAPQDPPKAGTQEPPPPIASETLKTLMDKVRDRVTKCEEALKASGTALGSFEAEITGKTLGEIDFKQLADHVGAARASIKEALGDTDALMRKLDNEIMSSLKEDENLLSNDGGKTLDGEKARQMTDTIRTVIELHDVLPTDSVAKDALEGLADTIDRAVNPMTMDDFLDVSAMSNDIVKAIMSYRRSLKDSVETLATLEVVLTILESKSRDLANLISRDGSSPDKASMLRINALVKEISENRDKALSIFKRIGRKVRDSKKPVAPANGPTADPGKSRMDALREKYMKTPEDSKNK